jgi:hypothetical protein
MRAFVHGPVSCPCCGAGEVRTDEVFDRGRLYLAECPRCEQRWTSRAPIAPVVRPQAAVRSVPAREAASAA